MRFLLMFGSFFHVSVDRWHMSSRNRDNVVNFGEVEIFRSPKPGVFVLNWKILWLHSVSFRVPIGSMHGILTRFG